MKIPVYDAEDFPRSPQKTVFSFLLVITTPNCTDFLHGEDKRCFRFFLFVEGDRFDKIEIRHTSR